MPRRYSVSFENVAITAVQDLFQIKGAAGKMLKIIGVKFGCTTNTIPTAQNLATRARFVPATVTDGSGGSTPLLNKLDPGDAAASFTALANSTVKATSSGTAVVVHEAGFHVYAGEDYTFPDPPCIGPSESFVYELIVAPGSSLNFSGKVIVEEFGG